MKTTWIFLFAALLIIIIALTLIFSLHSGRINLRKSNEDIREDLIEITPLGMNMEDVLKVIEGNRKWELEWARDNYGYGISPDGPGEGHAESVGVKSIRACIGEYGFIFRTYVVVYWGFDEDSKLIDIAVRKDVDAL
ncbi:MAG: hypothetical protein FWF10_09690 [Clostridiales bacterium]|nr:hypothetical protein [Clostridiales bacterium]